MNQINIIGRIGKDPENSTTQGGKELAKFSVAVTRDFAKDKTDWFNVTCWDKTAKFVMDYLGKGRLVRVTGRMESREYEGKTYWDLVAENVQGLDRPRDETPEPEVDPFA